jgi:hypothetical protein
VFGYGHLTWEWTYERPVRSFVYPALNVPLYWLLKVTGLDDALDGWLLVGKWLLVNEMQLNFVDCSAQGLARCPRGDYRHLGLQTD